MGLYQIGGVVRVLVCCQAAFIDIIDEFIKLNEIGEYNILLLNARIL